MGLEKWIKSIVLTMIPAGTRKARTLMSMKYDGQVGG